ncbi:DUF6760 family protein [Mastigocoleus testarum]|uniref:DUF6760 family protein n=1 Tax=Mastigocoleus testarum TaxID=996925 RepID=UPI00041D8BD7|nr:DUF6760 family protein [Mastigocoleus testarum]
MWARTRDRGNCLGGSIVGYPLEKIHEEVAFIAYHFPWSHDEIMNMEHRDRKIWCEEISKINRKLNSNTQS